MPIFTAEKASEAQAKLKAKAILKPTSLYFAQFIIFVQKHTYFYNNNDN